MRCFQEVKYNVGDMGTKVRLATVPAVEMLTPILNLLMLSVLGIDGAQDALLNKGAFLDGKRGICTEHLLNTIDFRTIVPPHNLPKPTTTSLL